MMRDNWRALERALTAYFKSSHVHIDDSAGTPIVEIVRFREVSEVDGINEITTASLSLERLAKHLADEFLA
jgi:hypothetical protein